ncbi:tryptophan synthase subunit alpha [Holophaga foetida]|uniref:tryptophan synthase subunit alpha n=1 Tax=Holophaga foetida TaxID=35839 RepID=UPI0002474620|nr:tryptophan synthase subunit alpha [Holophaga foetida]
MNFTEFIAQRVASGRKLLVPYLCAGYPTPDHTVSLLHALADGGADFIELGIPFSDPLADGPVLQAASLVALRAGSTLEKALEAAATFHAQRPEVPVALMGYTNPFLAMGAEPLARKAEAAGIAALLVPDLLPELWDHLAAPGMPPLVPFAAPNTPEARLKELGSIGGPFLYAVAVLGVTGARENLSDSVPAFLARTKAKTGLPVLAGFGISRPEQVPDLAPACDGLIIGSALAKALDGAADPVQAAKDFLIPFRVAMDKKP